MQAIYPVLAQFAALSQVAAYQFNLNDLLPILPIIELNENGWMALKLQLIQALCPNANLPGLKATKAAPLELIVATADFFNVLVTDQTLPDLTNPPNAAGDWCVITLVRAKRLGEMHLIALLGLQVI